MRRLLATLVILLGSGGVSVAAATPSSLRPSDFANLGFAQKLGAEVPLGLVLRDERGAAVPLRRFFHGVPVLLDLEYLHCPGLCGLVLGNLAAALDKVSLAAGRDYEVLAVSIDPHDGPADAAKAKADYLARLGAGSGVARWHFLTGSADAIAALAAAVGFRYRYDPALGQYAHPSGFTVLSPRGVVSRYMLGIDQKPLELRLGITAASSGVVAAPAARLLLLCFHYDPQTGRYTPLVMRLTMIACLATALALAGGVAAALWREKRRGRTA